MKKLFCILLALQLLVSCNNELDKGTQQSIQVAILTTNDPSSNGRTAAGILTPGTGLIFKDGDQMTVQWSFCLCGGDWASDFVNLELYRGSNRVTSIAENIPFFDPNNPSSGGNQYTWTIPYLGGGNYGNDLHIKIVDSENPSNVGYSSNFTINFSGQGTSFSKAIDLGNIGNCKNVTDHKYNINSIHQNSYGGSGDDVYYKFTLTSNAWIHIGNCNEIHPFRLYLFNQNQTLIESGVTGDCDNGNRIDTNLSSGLYYLISEGEPDGGYTFAYSLNTSIWTDCN